MGKTSKFSFPLPGRKQRANGKSQSGASPLAEEAKLSKAERLLGATGLPINNHPQNQRQLQQQQQQQKQKQIYSDLRQQPSSLTLTVYEPSVFEDALDFEPLIPEIDTMPALPDFLLNEAKVGHKSGPPPRSLSLSQKSVGKSSPEKKTHPRSMSNGSVPSARQFKSDSSLNNQYQLKAFPSISERSSPPRASERVTMNSYAPWQSVDPKQPNLDLQTTPKQTDKKRPSRLDLSKLFPKSSVSSMSGTNTLVSSPTSVFSAPHTESYMSRMNKPELRSPIGSAKHHKLTKVRPSQWQDFPSKTDSRPKTSGDAYSRPSIDQAHPLPRLVGPEASTSTKNWFDGLLEAEDAIDLDMEDDMSIGDYMDDLATPRYHSQAQDMSIRLVDRSSPVRPSPNFPSSIDMRVRRSSWQENPEQSLYVSVAEVQNEHTSIHSSGPTSNMSSVQSRTSVATLTTPVQPSFASFSKSPEKGSKNENESDADDDEFFDVRDSIALSDLDEEISIGEAQAFHVKTGHFVGPAIKSPEVTEFQHSTHQIAPSIQSPREVFQNAQPAQNGFAITRSEHVTSPLLSPQLVHHKSSDPRHKVMVVTEEEEALLEMMRQKRAAMASHNFAAGYKTALMSSPQSPMFMNAKRESLGAVSSMSAARSRSSRPNHADYLENIDPPLSPPPTDALPPPPEYLDDEPEANSDRSLVRSTQSSIHALTTSSNTTSLVIANLDPSHPQYLRNSQESSGPQLGAGFHYAVAGSPAASSGSGLSLSLSHSSTNGSGVSALPSPTTPHSHPAGLDFVMITNGSSRGSDASMDEILDQPDLSTKNSIHHQSPQYQQFYHKPQLSTNTVIDLDRADSLEIDRDVQSKLEESPKSDFEERMAEIRSKTMAATLAATKAYSIHTIRKRHPSAEQQIELEEQSQEETMPSPTYEPISHPKSPTHVHSGSGCSAKLDTRCSVADDVMEAWNNLGGWGDLEKYRQHATAGQA